MRQGPNVKSSMNRVTKHEYPKQRVAARLRRLGLTVSAADPNLGYDMVVDGHVRVTLRVAFPSMRQHRVTVQGRQYRYRYQSWHFNFHHHGEMRERYTDVFVCIAMPARGRSNAETFILPWGEIRGKTFSLHAGRRRYAGQYAPMRDQWQLIEDAAHRAELRAVA